MSTIQYFELNMNISRNVYEGIPQNVFVATAQKVAIYTVIPMALIVFFEAVVKNLGLYNLANLAIALLNGVQNLYVHYFPRASQPA